MCRNWADEEVCVRPTVSLALDDCRHRRVRAAVELFKRALHAPSHSSDNMATRPAFTASSALSPTERIARVSGREMPLRRGRRRDCVAGRSDADGGVAIGPNRP